MNSLLKNLVLGSSTTVLAAVMSTSAFAQANDDVEQVVVSASRVSIAGYTQPTPVTVIGAAQLAQDAYSDIQDSVRELPQVTSPPASMSANTGGLSGANGEQNLNLRNLGPTRTLVLFDGQRVVGAPLNGQAVDVGTLPQSVIQRVDVVTGGASATWGSDAVAGVVNFVINKNITGFHAVLEGSDTWNGDDRGLAGSANWGTDIFGGRGHIEFAVDAKINPDTVLLTDENWYKGAFWVSNPAYAAGNGQSQLIVASNVGLATSTPGGIINSSPAGTTAAANALRGIEFTGNGVASTVNYGNLTSNVTSNGGSLTDRDAMQVWQQIATPSNTYTFFGYGRYKLTDTIQASVQLNYGYFTGKNESGDYLQTGLVIRSDNAYIPASVASAMTAGGITSFTLGTYNVGNVNNYTLTGSNFYQQIEGALAPETSFNRRNSMRGVFTLDGELGDDWSWNAYVQHSAIRNSAHTLGSAIIPALLAAQDAVTVTSANVGKTGLALGSVACRSTLTGTAVTAGGYTLNGCVPLDVFGVGVASPASIAYITGQTNGLQDYYEQSFQQDVFEGSMQGVLPWELPAGKVAVAFGGGYRKEQGFQHSNSLGGAAAYAQGDFVNFPDRSYNVLEGFGEVDAPILKNNIVNSLDVQMAGRMTSYSTSGLVETWKLGATSQVNDDVKLRTVWSVDIRAPQLNDLYNPGSIGPQTYRDPKTQGTVTAVTDTTGNPNLVPETARTISGGIVLTPTFIPGLTFSADWYHINVTNEIYTVAGTTIVSQCNATVPSVIYPGQQGNPNDPLCKALIFNGAGGTLSQVNVTPINAASQTTSGLDLVGNYTMDFWEGTLNWATNDNYNDENTLRQPGLGVNDVAGSLGYNAGNQTVPGPKWRGMVSANYVTGPYSFTVQGRWFGTGVINQNGNTGNQASAATANLYDPHYFEVPFTAYLDLRGTYKWNDNISFFGAIDNVTNVPPPLVPNINSQVQIGSPTQFNTAPGIYDMLGRAFRVGVRIDY